MTLRKIFGLFNVLLLAAGAFGQAGEATGTRQTMPLRPQAATGTGQEMALRPQALAGTRQLTPLRSQAQRPALGLAVRGLGTTMRVLQITAHPGDEDGALLLYFARAEGARVTLLTLTRGEGGDNRLGIIEPTEQGLLRTMEQLASDEHYGAAQRFTRAVDFGFVRTADKVFERWRGHNVALADMVRVIRETRPEIIVTPFDTSSTDGDGQHEATAILVREAFRAAADAKKFPEQLSGEIQPWQAKRLFALARSGAYSVAFNATDRAAGEGESWQQLAERALAEQASQQGIWHAPHEHSLPQDVRRYRLVDSAPGYAMAAGAKNFTEGLDSRLESLSGDAGLSRDAAQQVQGRLMAMSVSAAAAGSAALSDNAEDRSECAVQIAAYLRNLRAVEDLMLGGHATGLLRAEVAAKRKEAEQALLLAAGVRVQARLVDEDAAAYVLVPGASFAVQVQVEADSGVRVAGLELKSEGGRWTPRREWTPGEAHAVFRGRVPPDAPFTRPQFLLESAEDGVYRILDERNATRALPPPALHAVAEIEVNGELVRASVPVEGRDGSAQDESADAQDGRSESSGAMRGVMVAPPVSVIVEPRMQWNRRTRRSYGEIEVRVRSNVANLHNALLSVHPPNGWRTEPEHEMLEIEKRGEEHTYRFYLVQNRGSDGEVPVRAVVRWGGAVFDQGYTMVRRAGVYGAPGQVEFDYRASDGWLISAGIEVPDNIEVGYVGAGGDAIPAALRGINVSVTEMDRESLLQGRLERFWAIVVGPHAIDVRDDLGEARTRLLHYAETGGTVVILAQSDAARFARNAPLPYSVELGNARVSYTSSTVEMIEEHDDLLQDPNEIGAGDFRNWSEELGRNFARRWDRHFAALLRLRDPGEPVQEGALIRARYGRGSVVYTGLSFYRQLPAGVPGAMRLLVNLLSAGAELHR